jgi:SSS family solute:Na+ symporter
MEFTTYKPFGLGSGVWGLLVSTIMFIGVSYMTRPPTEKAKEFMGYIKSEMKNHLKSSSSVKG